MATLFRPESIFELMSNLVNEFPVLSAKEILPALARQKGFLDEVLTVTAKKKRSGGDQPGRERKEYREIDTREVHPRIEKSEARFIEGVPTAEKFRAESSLSDRGALAANL